MRFQAFQIAIAIFACKWEPKLTAVNSLRRTNRTAYFVFSTNTKTCYALLKKIKFFSHIAWSVYLKSIYYWIKGVKYVCIYCIYVVTQYMCIILCTHNNASRQINFPLCIPKIISNHFTHYHPLRSMKTLVCKQLLLFYFSYNTSHLNPELLSFRASNYNQLAFTNLGVHIWEVFYLPVQRFKACKSIMIRQYIQIMVNWLESNEL